jgi:MarR family 2-MHQ and catechol resistance regulon transcriptional repressor
VVQSLRESRTLRLLRALHHAYRAVDCADAARMAEAFGLAQSEFDLLATLGNTDGMPMGQIASRMLTSPGNVTRLSKKLEERGLVTRQRASWSDRVVIARLTEEGEALFERIYPEHVAWLEGWFAERLPGDEQDALIELLLRLPGADAPPEGCGS